MKAKHERVEGGAGVEGDAGVEDASRRAERDEVELELGMVVATPGILETLDPSDLLAALKRHVRGDWGEVGEEDWAANDRAIGEGTRILSAYTSPHGERFWIITEADRSSTTLLLPEEY